MNTTDYQAIVKSYYNELTKAATGLPSSLSYIKNKLPEKPVLANGELFQVLVVGGTMLRASRVIKDGAHVTIQTIIETKQPVFTTQEVFLSFICDHINPAAKYLAISFAFPTIPLSINGLLDGQLYTVSKEHRFSGFLNKPIGKAITAYVKAKRNQDIAVSLANDTICLTLSGLTQKPWRQLAAGIIGTGMNFALFANEHVPVNLESGGFSAFKLLPSTQAFDPNTNRPGEWLFEKEISGRYLPDQFNYFVKQQGLDMAPVTESAMLSQIAADRQSVASLVAQQVIKHSAWLAAAACVAISQFQQRDLSFVMQGSVFWKAFNYHQYMQDAFTSLAEGKQFSFIQIENADIVGAAKLLA